MNKAFSARLLTANLITILALLLLAISPEAQAQSVERDYDRTLSVTGQGVVFGVPDVLQARVAVETENVDLTEALAQNNERMNTVILQLGSLGIERKDIQTEDIFIRERRDSDEKFLGFVVTNAIQITIRQLDQAGMVLDQAIQAGANSVSNVQFAISDPSPLLSEARALAVKAAQEEAEEIARAAGIVLGKAIRITSRADRFPISGPVAFAKLDSASFEIPIAEGQRAISVYVDMTFEINYYLQDQLSSR